MSFINKVVDKVYVINLDKDKDRFNTISARLAERKIEFERFPAILGVNIVRNRHISDTCNTYCTDGIKGCALSHYTIWQTMLEKGYERVLILEDDIILDEKIQELFEKQWEQIPKDFDVVYLGCNFLCGEDSPIPKVMNTLLDHVPENVNENVKSVAGSFGAYGYIISRKAAKVFTNLEITTHIDLQMVLWAKTFHLNMYSVTPKLITTNEDGNGSNLSESYPRLINSVLRKIRMSDTINSDWALSENFGKFMGFNINPLIVIFMISAFAGPYWLSAVYALWFFIEFLASKDAKNTFKYYFFIGLAVGLKYLVFNYLHPFSKRTAKQIA